MLVNFTVENWRSFRDEASLSMIASREQQHGQRLARIPRYRVRILPVAAIYGGNASGKTNVVEALAFAQDMVLSRSKTDGPVAVEPFLLDAESSRRPTRFRFEMLIGETMYEYGFATTHDTVVEERLVEIGPGRERIVFDRTDGGLDLDSRLDGADRLRFAFEGTDANQLYVANAVSQKIELFWPLRDWFRSLHLLGPRGRSGPCPGCMSGPAHAFEGVNAALAELDTGIVKLASQPVQPDTIGVPAPIQRALEQRLGEGDSEFLLPPGDRSVVMAAGTATGVVYYKQVAHHATAAGRDAVLDLDRESDGSRRLIDLLPCLLAASRPESSGVFVIDEIDRSLHTLLLRGLLERYLDSRSAKTRSQLVFTTHDVLLMDQSLLRRDEMWVTERASDGSSALLALSEYKGIRHDKDVRKSYLQGRLGGVPRLLLSAPLPAPVAG
ncbi:MAG: ATP-binding protein [Bifidobacteriaceae bacterium]|nr:ATP-binding protein [Bifidobacteriaceae bacterium]